MDWAIRNSFMKGQNENYIVVLGVPKIMLGAHDNSQDTCVTYGLSYWSRGLCFVHPTFFLCT